jgi:hypothetical protein
MEKLAKTLTPNPQIRTLNLTGELTGDGEKARGGETKFGCEISTKCLGMVYLFRK